MALLAVIDTNVLVSVLLTRNTESATYQVMQAVLMKRIIPLYNEDILAEYEEVTHRPKFKISEHDIDTILTAIKERGIAVDAIPSGKTLPDMDDLVFYEVALTKRAENAHLVTGNKKHFPAESFIVTPAEMVEILKKHGLLP